MGARTTTTTRSRSAPTKLTLTSGIEKPTSSKPILKATPPSSPDKYFWYTSSDNITRLATCTSTSLAPEQTNTYTFDSTLFAQTPYPSTFPPGLPWPPTSPSDLLRALGPSHNDCIGTHPFTTTLCTDINCTHTLTTFQNSPQTLHWQTSFQLRATTTRGLGVFTLRPFARSSILGWYAGELKPCDSNPGGDYLMELEIGIIPASPSPETTPSSSPSSSSPSSPPQSPDPSNSDPTILIDASRKGNWTRFINHSCDPYSVFRIMRVGDTRIMVVQAIRDIPAGAELSVSYGAEYYGRDTIKICACEVEGCVGEERRGEKRKGVGDGARKKRVKKCRRESPDEN